MKLQAFLCPSDPGNPFIADTTGNYGISATNTGTGGAKTNYDFVTNAVSYYNHCENWGTETQTTRRMFGDNSNCQLRDVIDGSSNTIAMTETTLTVHNGRANAWGYRGWVMVGIDLAYYSINNWTYGTVTYPLGTLGSWAYAGSVHAGGIHCLFGDGGVRFINQNINTTTRQRLCYMADGQVAGEY
jgi:hypothetical protein